MSYLTTLFIEVNTFDYLPLIMLNLEDILRQWFKRCEVLSKCVLVVYETFGLHGTQIDRLTDGQTEIPIHLPASSFSSDIKRDRQQKLKRMFIKIYKIIKSIILKNLADKIIHKPMSCSKLFFLFNMKHIPVH